MNEYMHRSIVEFNGERRKVSIAWLLMRESTPVDKVVTYLVAFGMLVAVVLIGVS